MRHLSTSLFIATAALCAWSPLSAQTPAPKTPAKKGDATSTGTFSAHETTSTVLGERGSGTRVVLVYGRPTAKNPKNGEDRKVWGTLVPFGKIWRLGSDEATLLISEKDLDIGGTVVPAGAHTLFLLPAEDGSAKLIVNNHVGQWGIDPYDKASEFAQIALTKTELTTPVDKFTMAIKKDASGATLRLSWENLEYSVPVAVKK
jgi:hypothetical protein